MACDDSLVADALDLCLASKSPRRRELLTQAGLYYTCCDPGEEYVAGGSEHEGEFGDPVELAVERARRKARGAAFVRSDVPVLAVDTVVDLHGVELGKAANGDAALALWARLAGSEHRVHTAHCIVMPARPTVYFEEVASSVVACRDAEPAEWTHYLDSEQWRGKAGGYGIQDSHQQFFRLVQGGLDTVVGLHVPAVRRLLRAAREQS